MEIIWSVRVFDQQSENFDQESEDSIKRTGQMLFSFIKSTMTIKQQIKRYLKISNPPTDLDSIGPNWYTKTEPLYMDFVKASVANLKPGENVSMDK